MQATAALCKLFDIHLFKDLDLNLRDLNTRESCVCVCAAYTVSVQTHTWAVTPPNCLTSTTMTFESNPSSPLARPCLTKDNPHRSAPAPCLLSSAITAVPQNPSPFSKKKERKKNRATTYVKYLQCCVSVNTCVLCAFLHQGKKKNRKMSHLLVWLVLLFFFLFHPVQEQTKVINALCEHEKNLSIM